MWADWTGVDSQGRGMFRLGCQARVGLTYGWAPALAEQDVDPGDGLLIVFAFATHVTDPGREFARDHLPSQVK
jgi:hypothetical protein